MRKCRICKEHKQGLWAWQPLGPAEAPRETFTVPGYYYRGFPVIPVCGLCKDKIQAGETVQFDYKRVTIKLVGNDLVSNERDPDPGEG